MNPLYQAGLEIQTFLQNRKWPFCFIGGIVVLRWGQVRMTQDIDLSVFTGFGSERPFISALLDAFPSRIPDAEKFALENRVLLLSAHNGVSVDLSLASIPFEAEMMQRASAFAYAKDCSLITCSAEDLIILKAFANRPQDWLDVESIFIRQVHTLLDTAHIRKQLEPLCEAKSDLSILDRLTEIIERHAT